jgi:hypothetical protein
MGYTTQFDGKVTVTPALSLDEYNKFKELSQRRHDHPAAPSYYCQWEPSKNGTSFAWDGNEKFYGSEQWMALIVAALAAAGHTCNGVINANGEERGDVWRLVVTNNVVTVEQGTVSYVGAKPVQPLGKPVDAGQYGQQLGQTLRLAAT